MEASIRSSSPTTGSPSATLPAAWGLSVAPSRLRLGLLTRRFLRDAFDEDLRYPAALHPFGGEAQVVEPDLLALPGDGPEEAHHQARDGVPFLVGELDVEHVVQLVDGHPPAHPVTPVVDRDHLRLLAVVLVGDLPDELLDQVLHGHQPDHGSVLVGNHGDVELLLLHLAQEL